MAAWRKVIVSGSNAELNHISSSGNFVPVTTDGGALGSVSLNWSDLFLDSGAVINFDGGDVTLTHSSNKLTVDEGDLVIGEGFDVSGSFTSTGSFGRLELSGDAVINGNLTFVSKSASPKTKTFKIESEIVNSSGSIKDGVTATMTIRTDPVLAHRISPSILVLDDLGRIGVKVVNSNNVVEFSEVQIIEDLEEGLWISGLPDSVEIIVQGQGFVEDGQIITDNLITNNG